MTTKKDGSYGFIVNDATLLYDLKMEKEGFVGVAMTKQKFSTVDVTIIPSQSMLKTSEAPAAARPGAGSAARGAAPPSSSEQAAVAYNAAVDLLNAGDRPGAEAKLKEAVAKSPDLPQAWHALAIIAYDNKDWAKTLEYGQKALDLDPSETDLYGRMKDAADKGGDKKASADWQKKYDELNADTPEVLYNKGVEAWNKKKAKDAEERQTDGLEEKHERQEYRESADGLEDPAHGGETHRQPFDECPHARDYAGAGARFQPAVRGTRHQACFTSRRTGQRRGEYRCRIEITRTL